MPVPAAPTALESNAAPGRTLGDAQDAASGPDRRAAAEALATLALEIVAVAAPALGGLVLRGPSSSARRAWLDALRTALPDGSPWKPIPIGVDADRLRGGLDLSATLVAGRPVAAPGLLDQADGGVVVVAMAERIAPGTAADVAAALDGQRIGPEGGAVRLAAVVLDEGLADDERAPRALVERVGLHLSIEDWPPSAVWQADAAAIAGARLAWRDVEVDDASIEALAGTALALGIGSLRPPSFALVAARAAAALRGRTRVARDDLEAAAALVLAPRATRLPPAPAAEARDEPVEEHDRQGDATADREPPPPPAAGAVGSGTDAPADAVPQPPAPDGAVERKPDPTSEASMDDVVVAAAVAAIPRDLLAALVASPAGQRATPSVGRSGAAAAHALHGRPLGPRRGRPRGGVRLDLLATLRAAAPWQRVRRGAAAPTAPALELRPDRLRIQPSDLHVRRTEARRRTTTIFAVDASGSAALHRLGEAKGAVELLLADCYVRRDSVALVAFRGRGAELLLPPTRSLTRAKRALGELPGGGGTPLAAGLDAVGELAATVGRRGETPVVVVLSDGRANVARDGTPGRAAGDRDARAAARRLGALGVSTLFVDTSPRPDPAARELAALLGARCIALPHADAAALSRAVRGVSGAPAVRAPSSVARSGTGDPRAGG